MQGHRHKEVRRSGTARKPKEDLAQTSENCLPARKKVDVAFYPCHFLLPYDSGGEKAGQRSTGTDGSRQRHTRMGRGDGRKRSEVP